MAAVEKTRQQLVDEQVLRHALEMVIDWQANWCVEILEQAAGEEEAARFQDITSTLDPLAGELWPEEDDFETPEHWRASGRACAAAAAMFAWLATDHGQETLRSQAAHHARLAADHLRKAESAGF